jgi:glycosyltransferase involved in cell wall biosynthesis
MEDLLLTDDSLDRAMRRTVVVVPAFNEAEVIGDVLAGLGELPCTVVVVDDGSSDGTFEACLPHPVGLLRHSCNLGQGAAIMTGVRYSLTQLEPQFVVTFDADGQHKPADVGRLVGALTAGNCDIALGTRFARPSDMAEVPRPRRLLLRAGVVMTRLSTGLPLTDTHNGLRAFTARAASHLALRQKGMAHASEILAAVRREGWRWCEVPVTVSYTAHSIGKGQHGVGVLDIIWDLVRERLR